MPVINTPPTVQGGTVVIIAVQLTCGAWLRIGSMMGVIALQAVQFDVAATATGTLGGTVTLHQGVQTPGDGGRVLSVNLFDLIAITEVNRE